MNAPRGFCDLKNKKLQSMFKIIWIMKKVNARVLTWEFCEVITKYRAIPIKVNNRAQAGPKSQLGGLKDGFFNFSNQVPCPVLVKIAPIEPSKFIRMIRPTSNHQFISMK